MPQKLSTTPKLVQIKILPNRISTLTKNLAKTMIELKNNKQTYMTTVLSRTILVFLQLGISVMRTFLWSGASARLNQVKLFTLGTHLLLNFVNCSVITRTTPLLILKALVYIVGSRGMLQLVMCILTSQRVLCKPFADPNHVFDAKITFSICFYE